MKEITKDHINEFVSREHVDFIYSQIEKDFDFYMERLYIDILRYRNYNRGRLKVDTVLKIRDKPWIVTEVTDSAATIESINDGEIQRVSSNSFVEILSLPE